MKIMFFTCLILLGFVILPAQTFAVTKTKSNSALKVSAEVKRIRINKNISSEYLKKYDVLDLALKVKIINTGDRPILLFNNRLNYPAIEIAQNIDEFETQKGEFSVYNLATSASFIDDKIWRKNKELINTDKPDSKKIFILLPHKDIEYEESIVLNLPKENENTLSGLPPWKTPGLKELKELPSVFIKLQNCELLDYGISKKETNRFDFAKELQKRWQKYGYLWLDEIVSEPIAIDLNSTRNT